jgi:chloramphenicol 3-O-phosphotransferase
LDTLTQESADQPEFPASRGLLVLTGASHTGKTSVARSILDLKAPPVALLGVDRTLEQTLLRPREDHWSEIPLAYELLRAQAEVLLRAGWFVVMESTFTYVPSMGDSEFHDEEIERLEAVASGVGAPFLLAQLRVAETVVLERAEATGRLPLAVVAETLRLHNAADMPDQAIRVEASDLEADQLARSLLRSFPA